MVFKGKHQLPAVIFKATSIIQKIGFQLMVCYKSHLVKLHAYFLPFFPKSTWKSCDSCLRGTTEPGWPPARSGMERGGGAWARHMSGEPSTRAPQTACDASMGRDLTQPHLPQPAGLVWGQTLRVRALVGDEGLSETPPYKETWAARGRRGWCSSKRVSFS